MTASERELTWCRETHRTRCRLIGAVTAEITAAAESLVQLCRSPQRTDDVETIASELIPLCDAMKFLRRRGPRLLRQTDYGSWGRPSWLWGVRSTLTREPHGRVLVIGTWNYPLLLPGVQIAQALAAGNTVLFKPAAGTEAVSAELANCFYRAGIPRAALTLLDSSAKAAQDAIEQAADLVVLTGSAATGQRVLAQAAERIIPSIMELSGCDAVIVLPGADLKRLAAAIDFGLNFNGGATCIGPRRLIIQTQDAEPAIAAIISRLNERTAQTVHPAARQSVVQAVDAALATGAVDRSGRYDAERLRQHGWLPPLLLDHVSARSAIAGMDLFAPVMSVIRVAQIDAAPAIVNQCPYRLAASVFGPHTQARELAAKLSVGAVTINDLIAPTADPRLPFGGRGQSGFGVTRGAEGLLAMTTVKVTSERRGRFAPHLSKRQQSDAAALTGWLEFTHARTLGQRLAGLRRLISSGRAD